MPGFWDSWQRPYRHAIVAAIRSLGPTTTSLIEGGCNCGPNLRLLRQEMPHLTLAGFDRSPDAVTSGRALLPADVRLELREWNEGIRPPVDVVLSCYSLCYVSPAALPNVLAQAAHVASTGLVIAEPMPTAGMPAGRIEACCWGPDTPEYRHDYEAVLQDLGLDRSRIERHPMPPWDRLNGLLVVRT